MIEVGDRVTYENGEIETILNYSDAYNAQHCATIVKVERPNWEVVEEKKELLTEGEREFLRLYMIINGISADEIRFNDFQMDFIEKRKNIYWICKYRKFF